MCVSVYGLARAYAHTLTHTRAHSFCMIYIHTYTRRHTHTHDTHTHIHKQANVCIYHQNESMNCVRMVCRSGQGINSAFPNTYQAIFHVKNFSEILAVSKGDQHARHLMRHKSRLHALQHVSFNPLVHCPLHEGQRQNLPTNRESVRSLSSE